MLDSHLLHALHVQAVRHAELSGGGERHTLFQVSTIEALLHGAYDGDLNVAELAGRGDLGLGTFNALDGELVLVDGIVYRAAEDGSVHPAESSRRSPFAVVTSFQPGAELYVGVVQDVDALLKQLAPSSPTCTAVRIEGRFEHVRLRSVGAQRRPYPPLADVLARQRVFEEKRRPRRGRRLLLSGSQRPAQTCPAGTCTSSLRTAYVVATCSPVARPSAWSASTTRPRSRSSCRLGSS